MIRISSVFSQVGLLIIMMLLMIGAASASGVFLAFVEVHKDGVGGIDDLDGTSSVIVSPDGRHVYAASEIDNAVTVFKRKKTGQLSFIEVEKNVVGLAGARSVTVSPDGRQVYTASSIDNAISVFKRNRTTGNLRFVEVQENDANGVTGLADVLSIIVSPDSRHVYAAGSADDAISVFSRDKQHSNLTFVEVHKNGVGGVQGLDEPWELAVSPNGRHLYAASRSSGLAVFSRKLGTGRLTFIEQITGIEALAGVRSLVVSPDGENVYAGGSLNDAVVVFRRNRSTGRLSFLEVHRNGVDSVDGLDAIRSVKVSPDGRFLYAAGLRSDAIAVFRRYDGLGRLNFVAVYKDGVDSVDGLDGVRSIAVSPDGRHIYTASEFDDAVAVFSNLK